MSSICHKDKTMSTISDMQSYDMHLLLLCKSMDAPSFSPTTALKMLLACNKKEALGHEMFYMTGESAVRILHTSPGPSVRQRQHSPGTT
jgi:hypothetical protein